MMDEATPCRWRLVSQYIRVTLLMSQSATNSSPACMAIITSASSLVNPQEGPPNAPAGGFQDVDALQIIENLTNQFNESSAMMTAQLTALSTQVVTWFSVMMTRSSILAP